ncbi:MAG: trigger factor [Holosporaceae bacterium]|jgi:trigger factor|nr:trigger factor [Holosporaceae bacterium]
MKILSKTEDGLKRRYNVWISKEELSVTEGTKLLEVAKQVKLDGFRPGKVPLDIVKRIYGPGVISESKKEAINIAAKQLIKDEALSVLFNYITDTIKDDENGLEFSMQLEVAPTFELKDLSGLELKKYVASVDDEHVTKALELMRKVTKKWSKSDEETTVEVGCKVIVDLNITVMASKKKKSEDVKDFSIIVGDENVNEEIWKHLLSAKVSDVREFSIKYPSDFKNRAFADKTINYKVYIKKIFIPDEHQMDDELAKDLGYENLEDVKKTIIEADSKYCENMSKDIMRRELLDKLSDIYDFPIPENMLNVETKEVVRQIKEEAKKLNKEFTPYIEDECTKIARKRVTLGFVVAEIAKKENISVSKNEIAQAINSIAKMYPGNEKVIWNAYSRREALPVVIGPILEGKIVDFLLDRIKISEEVKCSLTELIAIDEEPFDFFKDEALPKPSEAAPEAALEVVPEAAPEATPEVAPEVEVTPEATPEKEEKEKTKKKTVKKTVKKEAGETKSK